MLRRQKAVIRNVVAVVTRCGPDMCVAAVHWLPRQQGERLCSPVLFQPRFDQHGEKLLPGPHVHRLRHQLAAAVVNKAHWDTCHRMQLVHLSSRTNQHGVGGLFLADKMQHRRRGLIEESQDHQAFRFEPLVKRLEVGNSLPAGRAPGGPEVHQDHLSAVDRADADYRGPACAAGLCCWGHRRAGIISPSARFRCSERRQSATCLLAG